MKDIVTFRLVLIAYFSILLGYCLGGITKSETFLALIFVTSLLIFIILCKISSKLDTLIRRKGYEGKI